MNFFSERVRVSISKNSSMVRSPMTILELGMGKAGTDHLLFDAIEYVAKSLGVPHRLANAPMVYAQLLLEQNANDAVRGRTYYPLEIDILLRRRHGFGLAVLCRSAPHFCSGVSPGPSRDEWNRSVQACLQPVIHCQDDAGTKTLKSKNKK